MRHTDSCTHKHDAQNLPSCSRHHTLSPTGPWTAPATVPSKLLTVQENKHESKYRQYGVLATSRKERAQGIGKAQKKGSFCSVCGLGDRRVEALSGEGRMGFHHWTRGAEAGGRYLPAEENVFKSTEPQTSTEESGHHELSLPWAGPQEEAEH